jgi:hypothetical protein
MNAEDNTRTVVAATAKAPDRLAIRWSNGAQVELDLSRAMQDARLRSLGDPKIFEKAAVGEWGHSVGWPSGVELGAESLWLETLTATGHQDTREFLEWRLRHGLSLTKTADALGISRRMVAYYSNAEKPVPRPILLACKGWEVGDAA